MNSVPKKITTSEFIARAKLVHGDLYDYSKVKCNGGRTHIDIGCLKHGIFTQSTERHLSGHGCRFCNEYQKKTTVQFINESIKIHGDKYDYTKVDYHGDNKKVEIVCKKHGSFYQKSNAHINGQGCSKCGKDKLRYTTQEFIVRAKKVHGSTYDYSSSNYTDSQNKIIIICPSHGVFQQKARDHLLGCGCQKCHRRVSKVEIEFLNKVGIAEEFRQYPIPNTKYQSDGYDPKTNTLYEFLGDHWHGNPKVKDQNKPICSEAKTTFGDLYRKTIEKFSVISSLGYNINYIWETDWNRWKKSSSENLPILEYKK